MSGWQSITACEANNGGPGEGLTCREWKLMNGVSLRACQC